MRGWVAIVAIGLLSAGACGKSDWGYLEGTVLLNGQPVGPGTISLERIDAQRAGAMATFGAGGKYSVMSAGRKEGAATGEYRVLIQGGENFGVEETGALPKSAIPARYANSKTSELQVTIEPGKKTFDFELKP